MSEDAEIGRMGYMAGSYTAAVRFIVRRYHHTATAEDPSNARLEYCVGCVHLYEKEEEEEEELWLTHGFCAKWERCRHRASTGMEEGTRHDAEVTAFVFCM